MFQKVDCSTLLENPIKRIGTDWYLLTSGAPDAYNTMTASWGEIGFLWGTPTFHCFVRTNRYTMEYMDKNDIFTVSFFDNGYKPALQYCGSHSGRDCDKAKETGLQPIELEGATAFRQATHVLICKKKYSAMIQKEGFFNPADYEKWYQDGPLHREFVGEIIAAYRRTIL
jgi:flavin reductase (DIM6/NTAB) family NADH-FMN oxidoreductase RutF